MSCRAHRHRVAFTFVRSAQMRVICDGERAKTEITAQLCCRRDISNMIYTTQIAYLASDKFANASVLYYVFTSITARSLTGKGRKKQKKIHE